MILEDEVQALPNLHIHSNRCTYDHNGHWHPRGWGFARTNRKEAQRGKFKHASFCKTHPHLLCDSLFKHLHMNSSSIWLGVSFYDAMTNEKNDIIHEIVIVFFF